MFTSSLELLPPLSSLPSALSLSLSPQPTSPSLAAELSRKSIKPCTVVRRKVMSLGDTYENGGISLHPSVYWRYVAF